jgi:hypothetical protein
MSRPTLVTTAPKVKLCDRCRSIVLVGISEGLRAEVDMSVLTPTDQIRATLLRLELYALNREGLWYIDSSRARSAHLWTVVPQHRCGTRWTPQTTELPEADPDNDQPPY